MAEKKDEVVETTEKHEETVVDETTEMHEEEVVEKTEKKHGDDEIEVVTTTRVKTPKGSGKGKGAGEGEERTNKKKSTTKKKTTKKEKKQIVWWPWILAGGMVASSIIMCLCGRCRDRNSGCHDCERPRDTTEVVHTPDTCATYVQGDIINVGGDAIIVKGNDNDVALVKGNENHVAQRSTGGQRKTQQPRQPQKSVVVYDTVRVEVPKEEPVPEKPITLTLEATRFDIWVCRSY